VRTIEAGVRQIAESVRTGEATAAQVLAEFSARNDALAPRLSVWARRDPSGAARQAAAVDEARATGASLGPLAGVPVGLKDNFVTRDLETRCGSRILAGWRPPYQGAHAERLDTAGAVTMGKCAMDEFAMGSSNENTPDEPVHNPWALDHVPGGSSGGSAAAVAARLVPFSLGSDTGGSIRQPASLCGIVGLKPTYGRVSRYGMIAFASSLDQAGPLTRDVRDAAVVLGVVAGHDPRDSTSLPAPVPDYLAACDDGAAGARIGVDRSVLDHDGLDPSVRAAFEASLAVMRDAGATIVDIRLPHFEHAIATYYVLAAAEAASNLSRYDGLRYGAQETRGNLRQTYEATREHGFGDEVKRRIMLGTFVLREGSFAEYYGRAQRVRTLIARDYTEAFARCDAIASPTSPVAGFRIGDKHTDPLAMYLSDVFTIGANLAGLPAISIPGGFSPAEGTAPRLPIGFQLIGGWLGEAKLLALAAAHEGATTWHREHPPEDVR
jgi:aspartyl-tRNA(Asn)/glutamyl-tRNA(Gln) amidotransferase subunit A